MLPSVSCGGRTQNVSHPGVLSARRCLFAQGQLQEGNRLQNFAKGPPKFSSEQILIAVPGGWDPGSRGGGSLEVKDGEEEVHLRAVLLRVRKSPQTPKLGKGPAFHTG